MHRGTAALLRFFLLGLATWVLAFGPTPAHGGCTGTADCSNCVDCQYCQHCAKEHGTCGVKEGETFWEEQGERAAFAGSWKVSAADGTTRKSKPRNSRPRA